jgi:hypothetical protein
MPISIDFLTTPAQNKNINFLERGFYVEEIL